MSRATIRNWRESPGHAVPDASDCFRCRGCAAPLPSDYAALLGFYLGDGCISQTRSSFALRISCDQAYPHIIGEVGRLLTSAHPQGAVCQVRAPGVTVVQGTWKHWPCLFPQHGPGRKHERALVLEAWQQEIVGQHPGELLRGLFHSDGCRSNNWATRTVAGVKKRYDYPRWQFVNHSAEIRGWCTEALDALEIPWRLSRWNCVSVSTRAGVARMDEVVGPKR